MEELRSKTALAELYRAGLESFLASGARLSWPRPSTPLVSVVLVLYNRAELTLRCLRALAEPQHVSLEILIVDNASQDETGTLLDRLDGVRTIRNHENRGFIRAVNQAARRGRGRHLLCLNNDAELLPGALAAAVRTLESAPDVGAVGGKLILTDGRLQEAGCIVWNDGSCCGYGRGGSPSAPEYAFRRDVTSSRSVPAHARTCSHSTAASTRRTSAYYEDADYCLKLWESGLRVVRAASTLIHFSSPAVSMAHAVEQQAARREIFRRRHAAWLAGKAAPRPENVIGARDAARGGLRVLFIDDRVPHDRPGSGFPRSREMLSALVALGHRATFYPLSFPAEDWGSVYADVPREVEVMLGAGRAGLEPFLRERRGLFDVILVSRPHNMEMVRKVLAPEGGETDPTPVVYDAEALWCLREVGQRQLKGTPLPPAQVQALVAAEARLAEGAAAVTRLQRGGRDVLGRGHAPGLRARSCRRRGAQPGRLRRARSESVRRGDPRGREPQRRLRPLVRPRRAPVGARSARPRRPFRVVGLNRSPRIAASRGRAGGVRAGRTPRPSTIALVSSSSPRASAPASRSRPTTPPPHGPPHRGQSARGRAAGLGGRPRPRGDGPASRPALRRASTAMPISGDVCAIRPCPGCAPSRARGLSRPAGPRPAGGGRGRGGHPSALARDLPGDGGSRPTTRRTSSARSCDLVGQGIGIYLIDHGSTDGTRAEVEKAAGGPRRRERLDVEGFAAGDPGAQGAARA